MCEIVRKRKSRKHVYLDIIDGDMYAVKKLDLSSYEYAARFNNPDFLNLASKSTSDRDFTDAALAIEF